VLADVARTTSLRWAWKVTIRDSTPDRPEPSAAEPGTGISLAANTAAPQQRRLQLPELRPEGNDWDIGLPHDPREPGPGNRSPRRHGPRPDHRRHPPDLATLPAPRPPAQRRRSEHRRLDLPDHRGCHRPRRRTDLHTLSCDQHLSGSQHAVNRPPPFTTSHRYTRSVIRVSGLSGTGRTWPWLCHTCHPWPPATRIR
jgi:hypothetical protein